MPLTTKKKEIVEEITNNVQQVKAVIFYNFHGVDSESVFFLKKELKKVGAQWKVYRNNLTEKALANDSLELKQANALIFCQQDEYQPLKILNKFDRDYHAKNKINGGFYEKKIVSADILEKWAQLPIKEQLLQTFCYLLQTNLRRLVKLLESLKEKKTSP